jgi:hypothetical protein
MKRHLTLEELARLVDEDPTPEEARHLDGCAECRVELTWMERQRGELALLPVLRPPPDSWNELEERLASEGLLSARRGSSGGWVGRPVFQMAASLVLLLVGVGVGMSLPGPASNPGSEFASGQLTGVEAEALSLDEAREWVEITEDWHRLALMQYRDQLASLGPAPTGDAGAGPDPETRHAAIEALMEAGQAALRQAPTDPFLNGLLLNVQVEREASREGMVHPARSQWY